MATAAMAATSEFTPLLVRQDTEADTNDCDDDVKNGISLPGHHGTASFRQTVINLMKFCMGTGCLALPFAAQQGGVILFGFGMAAITAWNVYAVQRLVQCLRYVPNQTNYHRIAAVVTAASNNSGDDELRAEDDGAGDDDWEELPEEALPTGKDRKDQQRHRMHGNEGPPPPQGTSTLGMVAWYAFGPIGLQAVDTMMIILLLGLITTYFSAIITFLADTPVSVSPLLDAVTVTIIMATLSLVPNIGFLSHASAAGLWVLLATFLVVAAYGIYQDDESESLRPNSDADATSMQQSSLAVWPESITGVSRWFGCVVFSFGVPPLTYSFHSSMKEPSQLVPATVWAFSFVAVAYIFAGVSLYILYPNLTGDILHELPVATTDDTGGGILYLLPILTRLAMVTVILLSGPLLIVPTGQLLEEKWHLSDKRAAVRFGVCGTAVLLATALPGFVQILGLVGCACVGMVSFCVPPLLHLKLLLSARSTHVDADVALLPIVLLDGVMLAWGVIATVISTFYSI
jgi:amino acid permease